MDIVKALLKLRPGAKWTVDGNTYEGITWLDEEQSMPTQAEIDINLQEQVIEFEQTQYKRQREIEYPSFADQFDTLYHGGYDAWRAQIQAIKDKYPKPE
jgi:hypothetical protein